MSFISAESFRQAQRNTGVLAKVVIAQTIVIVGLIVTLVIILPLKTTEYKLYEFSSSGQTFYRIDSSEDLISRAAALVRFASRQYVVTREVVDRLTEQDRFVKVDLMSSERILNEFRDSYAKVNQALGPAGKRLVTIEIDHPFNNDWTSRVHIVEFKTEDTADNGSKRVNYWKAVIGYQLKEQKIRIDDLTQNPLGFEVTSYAITKRNPLNKNDQ